MSEFLWTVTNGGIWDTAANWFDETTGKAATIAPGPSDVALIPGPGLAQFQLIYGPAAAYAAEFAGNNALTPGFAANGASFAFGEVILDPLASTIATNADDLEAGVILSAGMLEVNSNLELDRAAAGAGKLYQGFYDGGGQILVLNSAALVSASWDINSGSLYIDPHSGAAIGNTGGGNAGVLTIDKNAALNFYGSGQIDNNVFDTGTITSRAASNALALPQINGTVSGTGQIDISGSSALQFDHGVFGISLIATGTQSNAQFLAGAAGIGSISIGSLATGAFDGSLQGTGTITVGDSAYLRVAGTVSGFKRIQLGSGATFATSGGDARVDIALGGNNKLALDNTGAHAGVNLTGPVYGFNATDLIQHTDIGLYYANASSLSSTPPGKTATEPAVSVSCTATSCSPPEPPSLSRWPVLAPSRAPAAMRLIR